MKKCFTPKRFCAKHMVIINQANEILETYEGMGMQLTIRQLYYQFVSRNWIENIEKNYKMMVNIMSDARLAGHVDWDIICDLGRGCNGNNHWTSPKDFMESVIPQFAIDKWAGQPNYVEVMVEKQALQGVILPVCERLHVRFTANKGYCSTSTMYEAGRRFAEQMRDGKEVHLIYLGDHDPSGIDMTRDMDARAKLMSGAYENARWLEVHRIALNMDQVQELNPPENPAKETDSRCADYRRKFGDSSWELDAIEPRALAGLVEDAVVGLRNETLWDEAVETEDDMKEVLEKFARKLKEN